MGEGVSNSIKFSVGVKSLSKLDQTIKISFSFYTFSEFTLFLYRKLRQFFDSCNIFFWHEIQILYIPNAHVYLLNQLRSYSLAIDSKGGLEGCLPLFPGKITIGTHISMKHEVSLVYITAHQAHQSAKRVTQIYNTTQCYPLKARITSLHKTCSYIFQQQQ